MPYNQAYLENLINLFFRQTEKCDQVYWLSTPELKNLIYINPAYEKIWGRDPAPLYHNSESWIDYIFDQDIKDYHPLYAMADRVYSLGSEAKFTETYRIARPNKEVRWIIDRGYSVCGTDGHVIAVTGVAVDITDDKKIFEDALDAFSSASLAAKLLKKTPSLTSRELQCIAYLMKGYPAKIIARKLNLSHRTVEFYIDNIKQKFGCSTKNQLISLCWEHS